MNTPQDIYRYIVESDKVSAFLSAIMLQKNQYSIAEIPDSVFALDQGRLRFASELYHLSLTIEDEEILTAVNNGLYVSAFISRREDQYQVHFLRHPYPKNMKARFEEVIAEEVVRYMILHTIVALKLNTWKKVDSYIGS